jgi:hypothetical protein
VQSGTLSTHAAYQEARGIPKETPLTTLHRIWRQVTPDDRLRFLLEMLTPNERRAIPFAFETQAVRVHIDNQGSPWWEAQDVCAILHINDVSKAVARIHKGEKRTSESRNVLIINESGLYRLIFRSNKPEAQRFQDWVFGEVLPTLRKTGQYTPLQSNLLSLCQLKQAE